MTKSKLVMSNNSDPFDSHSNDPIERDNRAAAKITDPDDAGEPAAVAEQMRCLQAMARERDAIIDSSSDGLFVCDNHATVIRINPASERIHKIKADAIVGRNMVDLIEQGFIDRSAALEAIQKRATVSLLQKKDHRKLISTGTPVFDDSGELIRVVVSERDITEIDTLQRCLEEEQAIKDQLQTQLAEMQQRLIQTQKIIARSPNVVKLLKQALKVSKADSSVLITGESGVGKGLVANLIHKNSHRAEKPLIRINCGAIPESLIESELFGYEKGAFTGARAGGKPGHLELADGGTLFLDEIAELPLSAQVKLLRFLEDGRVNRLGGTQARQVNARILAATHRDLKQMVGEGTFRHDLYYRLNVIPLVVPPVRERKECLLPLLRYYVDYFARKLGSPKRLSHAAVESLMAYPFPGNVRELMNICERAVVMSELEVIALEDLPRDVVSHTGNAGATPSVQWPPQMTLEQILQSVERALLLEATQKYRNQSQIAAALGVSQPTVARRMKKYGLMASLTIRER
ncbi:sigma-54 interaction domain-containing protein [Desulfosarcina ovata]|nr:sigma 54-interacting transcriptional regulator [Desulfosarcina ovata]